MLKDESGFTVIEVLLLIVVMLCFLGLYAYFSYTQMWAPNSPFMVWATGWLSGAYKF